MQFLAALFVGRPLVILAVAAVWMVAFLVRRSAAPGSARLLLLAALGWVAYAGWEWLVTARTPGSQHSGGPPRDLARAHRPLRLGVVSGLPVIPAHRCRLPIADRLGLRKRLA